MRNLMGSSAIAEKYDLKVNFPGSRCTQPLCWTLCWLGLRRHCSCLFDLTYGVIVLQTPASAGVDLRKDLLPVPCAFPSALLTCSVCCIPGMQRGEVSRRQGKSAGIVGGDRQRVRQAGAENILVTERQGTATGCMSFRSWRNRVAVGCAGCGSAPSSFLLTGAAGWTDERAAPLTNIHTGPAKRPRLLPKAEPHRLQSAAGDGPRSREPLLRRRRLQFRVQTSYPSRCACARFPVAMCDTHSTCARLSVDVV